MADEKNLSVANLLELLKTSEQPEQKWFDKIATELLTNYGIRIGKELYQIAELEVYFYSATHLDPFVHKSDMQLESSGGWYFHRQAAAKIGFTLKGVDITFGAPSKEYGGILIRAIRGDRFIEGPSNVVDIILTNNGVTCVNDLLAKSDYVLRLEPHKYNIKQICIGPRVGLKANTKEKEAYISKKYRYHSLSHLCSKSKKTLDDVL